VITGITRTLLRLGANTGDYIEGGYCMKVKSIHRKWVTGKMRL